eukprot:315550_1
MFKNAIQCIIGKSQTLCQLNSSHIFQTFYGCRNFIPNYYTFGSNSYNSYNSYNSNHSCSKNIFDTFMVLGMMPFICNNNEQSENNNNNNEQKENNNNTSRTHTAIQSLTR